jgi:predicted ATPase
VTSFVGRERQLAEVKRLLARTRLLTLFGMGGLGKTRLSLQAAADVLDDYADGVWFVELGPVADARLVPQAVASVLGVVEEAGYRVIEACADLARHLLGAGDRVRILASSREHLRVPGEATYPVAPLSLPDPGTPAHLELLQGYESVRLFVDRARATQPAFALRADNALPVVDICRRLDGIPLAIELAAARVSALPVETIAARLSDRFRLLTRGSRTALPRQQTLRALIDWSFDLLEPSEQVLFTRLSVFAGGFTQEAAEAVGPGDGIAAAQVVDLLTALVDKSLVELDAAGHRYRMLETVRHYAREKCDATPDGAATRTRHLDYFVRYLEKVRPELWGAEQGTWLARVDLERENLLAAHAWCNHAPQGAESGLRLVYAAQLYWLPRGLLELGYRITLEALSRPGAQVRDVHRSGALYAASQLAYFLGDYGAARAHADECLAVAREIAMDDRAAAALLLIGYASDALGDRARGAQSFEASAGLARKLGDDARLSFALNALAGHHAEDGNLDEAEAQFEASIALARRMGDQESVAISLTNLARIAVDRSPDARVRDLLLESHAIAVAIGSRRSGLNVIEVSAGLAVSRREWSTAARFYGATEAEMERIAMHRPPEDDRFIETRIARAREQASADDFSLAEAEGRLLTYDAALEEARAWLAGVEGQNRRV